MDFEATNTGSVRISQDVIASVAKYATLEIDGVQSVTATGAGSVVKGLVSKGKYTKPIKVEITDGVVSVEISVVVKHGVKVPDLAAAIQQNVKNAIQSMTGLAVSRADIMVSGIALVKEDVTAE